ncbi:MAG: AAA family ATPase, partial [Solirubrobacterales bacterium]|nr:AAA family ATPase [Solirubrobacterales bacterium]
MTDSSTAGPREAPPGLVGRQSELVLLDGMLDGIHDGGTALVWRGEAGVGKSALLDAARASAQRRGINTLWTAGSVVEAGLAFSGLQRLLAPVLDRVTQLPERQRGVLLAAVGAGEGSVSDLYLVALATLELIRIVAGERTLLLIADDVHHLDGASRDVLGFVGRRVETEPVVVLAALRDGADEGITRLDLPERQLAGLDPAAAGDLLDARAPDLSPTARARLLERSAGNPLALVELSDTAAEIDGPMLPISARLKRAFAARLDDMPPTTRDVLLTAAADEASSLTEIVPAAELLGGRSSGAGALQPALDAGLVTIEGDMLRFRHPLVRAAVYQAADLDRRHAAHGALAEVLVGQPDRRAWHRAACVIGSDDEVAAELEAVAWRAHRRGAIL